MDTTRGSHKPTIAALEEVEAKLGVAKGKQQRKPQQQRQGKIKEKVLWATELSKPK